MEVVDDRCGRAQLIEEEFPLPSEDNDAGDPDSLCIDREVFGRRVVVDDDHANPCNYVAVKDD
jgi:hypothetical protein